MTTKYYYDTTMPGHVVIASESVYKWQGHEYESLEQTLEGFDYGDELPYKSLERRDVNGLIRVLRFIDDHTRPVMDFLEHVEYVLESGMQNAVLSLLHLVKDRRSDMVPVMYRAEKWDYRLSCSLSLLLEIFENLEEVLGSLTEEDVAPSVAMECPKVFQGVSNPLELVIFGGQHYWFGTSREDSIHSPSFTELSEDGGEVIFGVLKPLVEDWVNAKPLLNAIEGLLLYGEVVRDCWINGPEELVRRHKAMCKAIAEDAEEISEFFSMMRQIRIAYARFASARKKVGLGN